jgi:hypothetical protein
MTEPVKLETDIRLARQSRVPVLITAPPDRALALARAIAAGKKNRKKTPPLVVCDGAAIVRAALGDRRENGMTDDDVVLVVREVHELSDTEQSALMLLFFNGEELGNRRIIATSSVCLLNRVARGTFNEGLFYRLNAIHIVGHSCSDRARVPKPCCSEEADDSSWGLQETRSLPIC